MQVNASTSPANPCPGAGPGRAASRGAGPGRPCAPAVRAAGAGLALALLVSLLPLPALAQPRLAAHAAATAAVRAAVVAALPRAYRSLAQGRVRVHYPPGHEAEARAVLGLAARQVEEVARLLGTAPPRVTLVLLPSPDAWGRAGGAAARLDALGAYWRGVIWVLAPSAWLDTAAPGWEETFARRGPVAHELAHQVLALATGGNLPDWWDEGVAQHVETRLGAETPAGDGPGAAAAAAPYPLARLAADFRRLEEGPAYREAAVFVRFLAETRGEGVLERIHGALAAGWPLAAALRREAGASPAALEAEWRAWLAGVALAREK